MKKVIIISLLFFSIPSQSQFLEVAQSIGINHIYNEVSNMGGGCVFFDYNNDGWEDLYITGGLSEDSLYKNKGDGTFEKINNIGFGITEDFNTIGVTSGDINNDGYRDLFVTTWKEDVSGGTLARNLFFINNGNGTFTESSVSRGITEKRFTMGAIMLDYNKDSFLDIYVVNYVESPEITYDSNGNANGFNHQCFENLFYENNGDGTFTEKAASLGLNNSGCALSVMATDFDQDNDQDIYIANDFGEFITPNTIYKNNYPTLNFTDVSSTSQMDVGIYAMGIAYADIDKDGDFDYYIANLGRNVLLENDGNQVFSDISTTAGVENTYTLDGTNLFTTSWGTAFLDVNNDTWQDLFVANGRVPALDFIATGEEDPNMLYINNGNSTFTGEILTADNLNRGRGMAYCDYDKDGDLDMVVVVQQGSTSANPKTVFFQNQLNPNGSDGKNWVQFNLEGVSVNKNALGAKVILTINGGEKLIQEVHGQGSHCSQHSLVLHFGLGSNTVIEEVKIIWSSSSEQTFTNVAINKRYNFTEGGVLDVSNIYNNKLSFYPNPINNKMFINGLTDDCQILISTIEGKIIKKGVLKAQNKGFNLEFLAKGIYIIRVFNDKQSSSKLFIKE